MLKWASFQTAALFRRVKLTFVVKNGRGLLAALVLGEEGDGVLGAGLQLGQLIAGGAPGEGAALDTALYDTREPPSHIIITHVKLCHTSSHT